MVCPLIGLGRSRTITGDIVLGSFFHYIEQCIDIGIGTRANILNIIDEQVHVLEHVVGRSEGRSMQAEDGNARYVLAVSDLFSGMPNPSRPCSGANRAVTV